MSITKETRQIREAFIDGFLSARGGNDRYTADAEEAWKEENTTAKNLRKPIHTRKPII